MKYAYHSASTPRLNLADMLAAAVRYGYEGLEIRSGVGHLHGIELEANQADRARLRLQAEEAGIALCCLGVSCRYSQPAEAAAQIAQTKEYIQLAHDLGIPYVRVFCGRIPEGVSREETKLSIIQALRELGPFAREDGVTILAETHDDWSHPAELAALLRAVGDANVAAAWDILHTLHDGGEEPEAVASALGPWIRHVHFHDGIRTPAAKHSSHPAYRPLGTGDVDYLRVARLLLDIGYEGYVSGEWFQWEPYELHLPREVAEARRLEKLAAEGGRD